MISLAVCIPAVIAMPIYGASKSDPGALWGGLAFLGLLAIFAWPIRYELTSDRFKWRSGLVIYKAVRLQEVDRITPGVALGGISIRKVPGHYLYVGRKKLFFAAADQDGLVAELAKRCPHLRQFGQEWRRELAA